MIICYICYMALSLKPKLLTISALCALLLLANTIVKSQEVTTLYYDKNGKGLDDKKNAFFYRRVKFSTSDKPIGTVEDFYISGKPYSKGEALYIDKRNDTKSRWTGTIITYNEKGRQIKQGSFDAEGLLDGKQLLFDKEGTKIQENDFVHGNPIDSFYKVYMPDGVAVNYSYLTKMPVNLATTDKKLGRFTDKNVIFQDGQPVQFYTTFSGLSIAARFSMQQLWGDYFEIYITIENGTKEQFNFDPAEVTAILQKDDKMIPVDILSYDVYASRVSHKQKWSPGFSAFSNAALLTPEGYQAIAIQPATVHADSTSGYKPYVMKQNINEGYLKLNTLLPGTRLIGFLNVKYKRADHFLLNVPVNGYVYQFEM